MKRHLRRVLGGIAIVLVMVYIGASAYLLTQEKALVFPGAYWDWSESLVPSPTAALPWDTLRIEADDGASVFVLESSLAESTDLWALFFHGNGGLIGSGGSADRIELLRDAGFNVLAVEFRGYGASAGEGDPSESGLYADARAGWHHLTESLAVEPDNVIAYGWSLGGGLATYLGAELDLGGIVTEGAFTSAPDMGASMYPWLPVRTLMRNRFDNLERAAVVSEPWLIFHGESDTLVPFDHGEALVSAAPQARLFPLDAGHNDGVMAERDVALAALRDLAEGMRDR